MIHKKPPELLVTAACTCLRSRVDGRLLATCARCRCTKDLDFAQRCVAPDPWKVRKYSDTEGRSRKYRNQRRLKSSGHAMPALAWWLFLGSLIALQIYGLAWCIGTMAGLEGWLP
jgi:hypothetical protein